jgi:hypothetical protein
MAKGQRIPRDIRAVYNRTITRLLVCPSRAGPKLFSLPRLAFSRQVSIMKPPPDKRRPLLPRPVFSAFDLNPVTACGDRSLKGLCEDGD